MRLWERKGIGQKETGTMLLLLILCLMLGVMAAGGIKKNGSSFRRMLYMNMAEQCMELCSPSLVYADSGWKQADMTERMRNLLWNTMPLYHFLRDTEEDISCSQSELVYDAAIILEGKDEDTQEVLQYSVQAENEEALRSSFESENQDAKQEIVQQDTQEADEENAVVKVVPQTGFVPAAGKSVTYVTSQLADPDFIKKEFYTEDATTRIRQEQLDIDKLLGFDATLKQDASRPQILIYHTHSQEGYADSVAGDASTTIMGVGEYLSAILRNQYGYNVLHHMGQYDVESRDYAYSNAAVGIEKVLSENSSIEVIIDLHRDEMQEDVKLITTLQGRNTAKFMFFNGLSYTRERGEITSLPNPYIQDNLAFAFQMKLAAEEYYPGLTRKSYLKGYRYNLQYRPKSLLIELGAQTNTVEEAMNACWPLAHILNLVLSGEMQE